MKNKIYLTIKVIKKENVLMGELVKILEVRLFEPITDEEINGKRDFYNNLFLEFNIDPKFKLEERQIISNGKLKEIITVNVLGVYVEKGDVIKAKEILNEFNKSKRFEKHDELNN